MTKERKIAIELWQAMKEKVSKGMISNAVDMLTAKNHWLEEQGIDWYCSCWFCHYFRKAVEDGSDELGEDDESTSATPQCPLNARSPRHCDGHCEQYSIACNPKYPMEQRLDAVDNIIKAFKGEYKEW